MPWGVAVGVVRAEQRKSGAVDRGQVAQIDDDHLNAPGPCRLDRLVQAHDGVGVELAADVELADHAVHAPPMRRWVGEHGGAVRVTGA